MKTLLSGIPASIILATLSACGGGGEGDAPSQTQTATCNYSQTCKLPATCPHDTVSVADKTSISCGPSKEDQFLQQALQQAAQNLNNKYGNGR